MDTPIILFTRASAENVPNVTATAGQFVTRWRDLSGNGNHALPDTDANRPTATENGVQSDGTSDYLYMATPVTIGEIYIAFRSVVDPFANTGSVFGSDTPGDPFRFNGPETRIFPDPNVTVRKNGVAVPNVFGFDVAPVTSTMVLTIRPTNPASNLGRYLFYSAGGYVAAELFEVRVFASPQSAEDRATIEAEMMAAHLDTDAVEVPITDDNLFFSPYNWKDGETNTPGAYLKMGFTGPTCKLMVDIMANTSCLPLISYQIDDGPFDQYQMLEGDTEVELATGLAAGAHSLHLFFSSYVDIVGGAAADKWNTPNITLKVTGFELSAGEATAAPVLLDGRMLVDGDSITEGVRSVDINTSDGRLTYAQYLARAFNCEVGVRGFGSLGYLSEGVGNVPMVPDSMDLYWAGESLLSGGLLVPEPDYIVSTHGTNDWYSFGGVPSIADDAEDYITRRRAEAPDAAILMCVPFGHFLTSQITAGITAADDDNTFLVDLDVSLITEDTVSDGVHPNAVGHSLFGAMLAAEAQRVLLFTAPDAVAPTIASALIPATGDRILWTLAPDDSTPFQPVSGATGFSVTVNGVARTITSTQRISAQVYESLLSSPVAAGQTILGAYSQGSGNVTDDAGNELTAFAALAVTNNSTADIVVPAAPTLTGTARDGRNVLVATAPADSDTTTIAIERNDGHSYSIAALPGAVVTWIDTNVTNGVAYTYNAVAFDEVPNASADSTAVVLTPAPMTMAILEVDVVNEGAALNGLRITVTPVASPLVVDGYYEGEPKQQKVTGADAIPGRASFTVYPGATYRFMNGHMGLNRVVTAPAAGETANIADLPDA